MLDLIVVVSSIVALLIIIYKFKQAHQHNKHLTDELKQERQRNANIESDLAHANQKMEHISNELERVKSNSLPIRESREEHLSSENERLTNELKQEHQRNVNLERKLRISGSSLSQASQDNEGLSNQLAQERLRNTELEKELRISGSSAYHTLLDAIYAEKRIETDEQRQKFLGHLRKVSEELGKEYQAQCFSPDYSRQDYQEAYLLRYFLPYSQPIPYLLNRLILKKDFPCQLPQDGTLTASFFGCGPGPELYGLMHYLGGSQSGINISAAMLDIATWEHGRKIVFEHLLPRVKVREFKSNLVGNARDFLPDDSEKWVSNSDLIVIQHCLNEQGNARDKQLLENLEQIVRKMKPGAVMLIVERAKYLDTKDLFGKFRYELDKKFGNSLAIEGLIKKRDGIEIKPILEVIPKELAAYFFMEDSSNSVNPVKFIWMAIAKK